MTALRQDVRRTKLIWSLEAECFRDDLLKSVELQDFDGLRLVYQHGCLEKLTRFIASARSLRRDLPIMLDMACGIQATVFGLDKAMEVGYGQEITLVQAGDQGGDLQIDSAYWPELFREDASVYIGYGHVVLKVKSLTDQAVIAEVMQGGTVYPEMDLHVPVSKPRITSEDILIEDLDHLLKLGIDYIVLPGLVDREEILSVRAKLQSITEQVPWMILKIDSEHVLNNANALLKDVDGLLISRLDMALSIDPAMIPIVTKEVIQAANSHAKLVFTASEMLGSMRHNATPTRAEVSDIANAVWDGSDAVVLSEEVSYGPYAARAVKLMSRIIKDVEGQSSVHLNWAKHQPKVHNEMDAVAYSAYKTAERVGAKALVCITMSGNTPMSLAAYRAPIPIVSVTFSEHVNRRLQLMRGVQGLVLDATPRIDDVLPLVNDRLVRGSWLKSGDRIVFVSVTLSSLGREASNLFTIQTIT